VRAAGGFQLRLGFALAPLALGCVNAPLYFASPTPILSVTGEPDAKGNPSRIENGLALQFRTPNQQEQQDLDAQATALGFMVPWIQRAHVHLELAYVVTNTETPAPADAGAPADPQDPPQFSLGIDGANEYTKYDENVVAMGLQAGNNNASSYIPLIAVTPQTLAAGESVSGTVREDDFNEAELDLDAMGRWMAPFNAVLINNSQVNPIGLAMVPGNVVLPALMEVDVNFSANRHMTCTYVVRVRDDDDQLLHQSGDTAFSPTPTLFEPPAMTTTN
jgi:hypothetical protein